MVDTTSRISAPTPALRSRRLGADTAISVLEKYGLPLFLLLIIIWFSTSSTIGDVFRSGANLQNIFANQSVTGLIALGMVIPLIAGYFDLSVAAIAGASNVMVASLIGTHGQPVVVGLTLGVVLGAAIGAINGLLVAVWRLNGFICTLGTYIVLGGLLQWYTGGRIINSGLPPELGAWGSLRFLGIAQPFWLLLIVAFLTWYLLTQTPFGRRLTAIGSNEPAARLAGIRVNRSVFIAFVLSGLLAGVAGALLTSRSAGADATTAATFLFPALAAVFLGQTAIRPGQYNVWGAMFGVFFVAVAVNGFTLLGAQSWVTQVFNGAALIVSIAVSRLMTRARERRASAAVRQAQLA
jgi:ribose transport system permease protein